MKEPIARAADLCFEAWHMDDPKEVIALLRTDPEPAVRISALLQRSFGHGFLRMTGEDWLQEARDILEVLL